MARKAAAPKRVQVAVNPHQAPSIYSNLCAIRIVGGDLRITFHELMDVTEARMTTREIMNVYLNANVAKEFAKILVNAVVRMPVEDGHKKSKATEP